MEVKVMKPILSGNQRIADTNRRDFGTHQLYIINVMASPGAGKTSTLLRLLPELKADHEVGIIEGDLASTIDAEKFQAIDIPVIQINTGGGCHLDAEMIRCSVPELMLPPGSFVFIENVGNLVCPAGFDLGENIKLVILSVSEGDDKPYKYIEIFENADVVVLNKTDLKPYIDFNDEFFRRGVRALNEDAPIFEISCKTGEGIRELAEWLKERNHDFKLPLFY
jgi:hydrogenase nickel incorporation protein HypB